MKTLEVEKDKCMTIRQLKELIKDWPDYHPDGTECEVWIEDSEGYSNGASSIYPLNVERDAEGSPVSADLIIAP